MEFGVREPVEEEIRVLRFAAGDSGYYLTNGIVKADENFATVRVREIEKSGAYLRIMSEQHARDMIKALNKAIELGWFKE